MASLLQFKFASDKVWMCVKPPLLSAPPLRRRLVAAAEAPEVTSWDGDTAPASSWPESGRQCFRILIASSVRPSVHVSVPPVPPSTLQTLSEPRLGFRCCVGCRGLRRITRRDSGHARTRAHHRIQKHSHCARPRLPGQTPDPGSDPSACPGDHPWASARPARPGAEGRIRRA